MAAAVLDSHPKQVGGSNLVDPRVVVSTSTFTPDSAMRKRRPLLVAQESAEASPAQEVELDRPAFPRLSTLKSDEPYDDASAVLVDDSKERSRTKPFSWIETVLEVPTGDGDLQSEGLGDGEEEEGITRIMRSTFKLERVLWYGVGLCVDQVMTCLTILPLRIAYRLVTQRRKLVTDARAVFDVSCFTILVLAVLFLAYFVGAAQVYHSIRLQTFMKLYVVVNIAEVLDRLLSSLGLDLFELLAETSAPGRNWIPFAVRYVLCLIYTCLHALLFYVRLLTLSVAVNSSNDALFTILVSNNFVELKGSVFKRSTEQNLFQISCSDVVERFVLIVFMFLVGLNEYQTIKGDASRTEFLGLMSLVLLVEVIVDWIKHMFIVRFNSDIRVKDVYDRFLGILADDFKGKSTVVDESRSKNVFPAVPKRLGLPIIPITAIIVRVVIFDVSDVFYERSWLSIFGWWIACLVCKLALKQFYIRWTRSIAVSMAAEAATSDDETAQSPGISPTTPVKTPSKLTLVTSYLPTAHVSPEAATTSVKASATLAEMSPMQPVGPTPSKASLYLAKSTPVSNHKKTPAKVLSKVNRFENG